MKGSSQHFCRRSNFCQKLVERRQNRNKGCNGRVNISGIPEKWDPGTWSGTLRWDPPVGPSGGTLSWDPQVGP